MVTTSILHTSKTNPNNSSYNQPIKSDSSTNLKRRTNINERRKQLEHTSPHSRSFEGLQNETNSENEDTSNKQIEFSPEIMEAADKVTYITNHIKSENYYEEVG